MIVPEILELPDAEIVELPDAVKEGVMVDVPLVLYEFVAVFETEVVGEDVDDTEFVAVPVLVIVVLELTEEVVEIVVVTVPLGLLVDVILGLLVDVLVTFAE